MAIALSERLLSYFSQHPTERCYIVFDSIGHEQLPAKFFELAGECNYQPFLPNGAEIAPAIQPFIVELPALAHYHPFWQWLSQQPNHEEIYWPIASQFDIHTVLAHLRSMLQIKLPDGKSVNFRLFDPGVLSKWWPWQQQHEPAAMIDLLKPMTCCWLPVNAEWVAITNPHPSNKIITEASWLILTKEQLAQLNTASEQVLFTNTRYHLYDKYPQVLAQYHPDLIDLLIDQALTVAQQQGMQSEYAITQWVVFMLSMGPTFYQDKRLAQNFLSYKDHQDDNRLIDNLLIVPAKQWLQVHSQYNASGWFC